MKLVNNEPTVYTINAMIADVVSHWLYESLIDDWIIKKKIRYE